jgi:hypothetical protein
MLLKAVFHSAKFFDRIEIFFCLKPWFHERFLSAKCEIFRLFLLNCEQSSRNNLFEWSQFKRNRRNISHFADKKRSWNQGFTSTQPRELNRNLLNLKNRNFGSIEKFRLVENRLNFPTKGLRLETSKFFWYFSGSCMNPKFSYICRWLVLMFFNILFAENPSRLQE